MARDASRDVARTDGANGMLAARNIVGLAWGKARLAGKLSWLRSRAYSRSRSAKSGVGDEEGGNEDGVQVDHPGDAGGEQTRGRRCRRTCLPMTLALS